MPTKTIKVPRELHRMAVIERGENGKPERISVSSDKPYKRYDWMEDEEFYEVLDHSPSGIDDERLKAGLPFLFNHQRNLHLARAQGYENDGHKLTLDMAQFIWASGQFAAEKKADIESGALPDTSVGYEIIDNGREIGTKDGLKVYAFKWRIYESSAVTIPADISVGVGRERALKPDTELKEILIEQQNNVAHSDKTSHTQQAKHEMNITPLVRQHFLEADNGGNATTGSAPAVDLGRERERAVTEWRTNHRERCQKIDAFTKAIKNPTWRASIEIVANKHKDLDANFDEFRAEALNLCTTELSVDTPFPEQNGGSRFQVIGDRPQHPGNSKQRGSIGEQFVRSKEFKTYSGSGTVGVEYDISILGIRGKVAMAQRAGFTSTDLAPVNVQIQSGVLGLGIQRLTIMDLIAPGTTGAAAIIYPRENTMGTVDGVAVAAGAMPRAKTVGERGLKALWEPDLTTETATVKQVAITTRVPNQFLADFPASQSYIDERLPFMVDTETEYQLLYGDGIGNNLKGITATTGIQTRAVVSTTDADTAASLKKGLTDIQVNSFFEPTGYAFHPYDWETASLLKDTSGRFLAGGPYYIPYTAGVFQEVNTFWGKPVVVSTAVTYGKPLAGAWKLGAQYFMREGMRLEMTNSNEDDFRRNMIMFRAEHRLALAVYRPSSFIEFLNFPARAA